MCLEEIRLYAINMITILDSIVNIWPFTKHKNIHFDIERDTHTSSTNYEESGPLHQLEFVNHFVPRVSCPRWSELIGKKRRKKEEETFKRLPSTHTNKSPFSKLLIFEYLTSLMPPSHLALANTRWGALKPWGHLGGEYVHTTLMVGATFPSRPTILVIILYLVSSHSLHFMFVSKRPCIYI